MYDLVSVFLGGGLFLLVFVCVCLFVGFRAYVFVLFFLVVRFLFLIVFARFVVLLVFVLGLVFGLDSHNITKHTATPTNHVNT